MHQENSNQEKYTELRKRAEQRIRSIITKLDEGPNELTVDIKKLLHELQVHQIELEIQNDELRNAQLIIEESRQKYFDLYNFAPVGYFSFNKEGHILDLNLTAAKLLGGDKVSFLNSSFYRNIVRDDRDLFYWHLAKVLETKSRQSCELKLVKKDGTEFYTQLESVPVQDEKNEITNCRTAISDITERRHAEKMLRIKNNLSFALSSSRNLSESFDRLLDASFEIEGIDCGCVYLVDNLTGNIDLLSHKGLPHQFIDLISHYDKDTPHAKLIMTGKPVYNQKAEIFKTFNNMGQGEGLRTLALIPIKYNGQTVAALNLASHSIDEFPMEARLMIEAATNHLGEIITRIKLENELEESEERFRLLYENAPLGYQSLNADGEIIDVNGAWLDILGYTHEEVLEKRFSDFLIPASQKSFKKYFQDFKTSGKMQNVEYEMRKKDGSILIASFDGKVRYNEKGDFVQTHCIFHNITERKRLEEQLMQSQKMETIGKLAGGIAHDFNNLLTAVIGNTEFLLEALDPEERNRAYAMEIKKAADRAAALTHQLLAYGRKQPLQLKSLNLNEIIKNMSNMVRRILGENIQLTFELESNLQGTEADPNQIAQIIMNLLINAKDAIRDKGEILIKTENVIVDEDFCKEYLFARPGKFIVLTIVDNGTGIETTIINKIFDPYFTTKGFGEGAGLGLSMVDGIVKQHNGWITVVSEPNVGSTFKVYLPATSVRPPGKKEHVKTIKEYRGNGERILLVEDEEVILEFIDRILTDNGYTVFTASTAEEALDIFQKENGQFHLVFSDIILPGMSGTLLVDELLSLKPELKVVFSSGYTDYEANWSSIQEKGYQFIAKPYSFHELLQLISEILSGK
jgi:PAS domain S-box-containing protein